MAMIQLLSPGPHFDSGHDQLPHVLFVVDGFPKALGGGERVVLRLAALLPRYGFRASILTFARHPESAFVLAEAPCPTYLLPITNTYGPAAWRGALALSALLRSQDVRIVQTFFESSDLWAGVVTRVLSRAKLVWSRRDMGILRDRKHVLAYRALRRLPHAVSAVSARVAAHVIKVDGVPAMRVRVIHNGLDLMCGETKDPLAHVDRCPIITTIGNIRQVKGHDVLIEAAALVVREFPNARFTIAGEVLEPAYFAKLKQQVMALGLERNVAFLGAISDLRSHLEGATLFVLPSYSEGFSNALVEAMAMGVPPIATDVGGNSEAIEDGATGLIVSPGDADAMAKAICLLLRDSLYAQRISIAARRRAETEFSSEAMMRKVTELFQKLLSK